MTDGTQPPHPDPSHDAWLAHLRSELIEPVAELVEATADLVDRAEHTGDSVPAELHADLVRVRESAGGLQRLAAEVLERSHGEDDADFQARARHDLANPLNHVIGYTELWLEDPEPTIPGPILEGLTRLLDLGRHLADRLGDILSYREQPGDDRVDPIPEVLRDLVAELPPRSEGRDDPMPSGRGLILVVDDSDSNRDLLARRLARLGHEIDTAADGAEALRRVAGRSYDVVLLDLMLPGINGLQVLMQLKGDDATREIPVLMISALDEIDGVVRCIEMGAEDYLTKPINPVLLKARLDASLEKKRLRDLEIYQRIEIGREKERADALLHAILPPEIVNELTRTDRVKPRRHEGVAVMFCDVVGFTTYSERHEPEDVVARLDEVFGEFEELALRHEVQKIKTVGDAFMAAAGLLRPVENPVANCIRCGLEMIAAAGRTRPYWEVRVGVHIGGVVAGVLGRRQYLYDLWGDTVNTAARIESQGIPGSVTLSGEAWRSVAHLGRAASLGPVPIKGKGALEIFRFEDFNAGA